MKAKPENIREVDKTEGQAQRLISWVVETEVPIQCFSPPGKVMPGRLREVIGNHWNPDIGSGASEAEKLISPIMWDFPF